MEEEKKVTEEAVAEEEVQTTFNEDGLDILCEGEGCTVENQEEVDSDANENE